MTSIQNFHPKYRQDIDGLRAIAILPVIVHHGFPTLSPGGFVGVDIFFVISGYLISLIIFNSLANQNLSFVDFYSHRIKRVFPALILVMGASYALGWFALLPDEFQQLGKHIAAGMGFVQNFVLWRESGYFDAASELKPLMHIWSLAIEEQFYLFFPVIVWLLWRSSLNVLTGIALFGVCSFWLSQKGVNHDVVKTFFAPHTRFWELLAGSLLAHAHAFQSWPPMLTRCVKTIFFNRLLFRQLPREEDRDLILTSIVSLAGLALIAGSIAMLNRSVPYPGGRALFPILGTLLLILAGPNAWVNRHILASKPFVWVGLISYPLYLWHWPLLSFARIVESGTPSRAIRIVAICVSFGLAALTYLLIEKPIRYGRPTWHKTASLIVLAMALGLIGFSTYQSDGFSFRLKNAAEMLASFDPKTHPGLPENQDYRCKRAFPSEKDYCRMAKDGPPTIQIVGDSHANALFPGMQEALSETSENVLNIGQGGCPPFFDVDSFSKKDGITHLCSARTNEALNFAVSNDSIKTVILVARGPLRLSGKGFYYDNSIEESWLSNGLALTTNPELLDYYKIWEISMRKTLSALLNKGKKVIFVIDNPELGFNPKSCLDSRPIRLQNHAARQPCAIPRRDYDHRNEKYRKLVTSVLSDFPTVQIFDTAELFCDSNWCWASNKGQMYYRDDNHLSLDGAKLVATGLMKLISAR